MSSHEQANDEAPPAVPPRSTQRDSRGSPHISPVQPNVAAATTPSQLPTQNASQLPREPENAAPSAQPVPNFFTAPQQTEVIKTKRQELAEGDKYWQWKIGFRVATIILGLIGIGCAGYIVSHFTNSGSEIRWLYYYLDDGWTMPWTLITFAVSVIWSFVCVVVFFARKPNAPVHPGAQVGVDLILWLAFICTGLFAIVGTMSVASWGSDGRLGYSGSGSGYYTMNDNNTWSYHSTQYSSYYGDDRDCNATGSYRTRYSSTYLFDTCEEQDAYVNAVWRSKSTRYNLDLTATVCQFLSLALHLTLFVWACVDTHYRNHRGVTKDAEKLAADIVMNMVRNGAIIPAPGQAHFQGQQMPYGYAQQPYQPLPGNYQVPPQNTPVQQPVVASSSNEKGTGPRYA